MCDKLQEKSWISLGAATNCVILCWLIAQRLLSLLNAGRGARFCST